MPPQAASSVHRVVVAAARLDAHRRVVLNAVSISEVAYGSARMILKVQAQNGWRTEAACDIRTGTTQPGEDEAFLSAKLHFGDFDADGRTEVAAIRICFPNSGGDPAILTVFRIIGGKLIPLGSIASGQEIAVRQMSKDGRTQFLNSYEIGWDMSHAEMPRWNDIYEVCSAGLKQVNAKFPFFYRRWLPKLRSTLVEHPADKDTWAHYGFALSYAKQKTTPRQAYMSVFWRARSFAKQMSRQPQWNDPQKQMADVRTLYEWAKQNKPFPKAIKPYYWFGDEKLGDQSPRDYPSK